VRTDPGVIDLGTVTLGPEDQPPAPEPAHRTGGWLRRWWPMAALALVLVAGTSAAAPLRSALPPHFQVPAGRVSAVVIADQTLFVAAGRGPSLASSDPEWTLSAYRLADGFRLWTVDHAVSAGQPYIAVEAAGRTPLVTVWSLWRGRIGRPVQSETSAYDPDTGELRWRRPGFVAGVPDGQVVLERLDRDTGAIAPTAYRVATVDLATGQLNNTHQLELARGQGEYRSYVWTLSPDGRHLATLHRNGELSVRDLTGDATLFTDLLPPWHDALLTITSNGALLVSTLWEQERTLATYTLDPPAFRGDLADQPVTARLTACGPVGCVRHREALLGIDPATGAPRWSMSGQWQAPAPLGAPWPDGHLHLAGNISLTVVWSRDLPADPTSARIYRDGLGHWYVSFVVPAH
jgi:hypothetical protein